MLKWFYARMKLRISFRLLRQSKLFYPLKADPMIVYIDVNKPSIYWNGEDESHIRTVSAHFEALGYCPIVRD